MKSFKKIALAMVAAVAMGTLATPASAAPMVVTSVKKNTGTVASPTWTAQTAGTAASAGTRPQPKVTRMECCTAPPSSPVT